MQARLWGAKISEHYRSIGSQRFNPCRTSVGLWTQRYMYMGLALQISSLPVHLSQIQNLFSHHAQNVSHHHLSQFTYITRRLRHFDPSLSSLDLISSSTCQRPRQPRLACLLPTRTRTLLSISEILQPHSCQSCIKARLT